MAERERDETKFVTRLMQCHSERSEESLRWSQRPFAIAQGDMLKNIKVRKVISMGGRWR